MLVLDGHGRNGDPPRKIRKSYDGIEGADERHFSVCHCMEGLPVPIALSRDVAGKWLSLYGWRVSFKGS